MMQRIVITLGLLVAMAASAYGEVLFAPMIFVMQNSVAANLVLAGCSVLAVIIVAMAVAILEIWQS